MAQFGSVPVLGTGGRRFKSCHPDSDVLTGVPGLFVPSECLSVRFSQGSETSLLFVVWD